MRRRADSSEDASEKTDSRPGCVPYLIINSPATKQLSAEELAHLVSVRHVRNCGWPSLAATALPLSFSSEEFFSRGTFGFSLPCMPLIKKRPITEVAEFSPPFSVA
jgi:hypothetical protein